jgi:DNA-binding XRE family transcriptional regulator
MLARMKKRPIKRADTICFRHAGVVYQLPKKVAEKYRLPESEESIDASEAFQDINKKYTKPGALLQGIRVREGLSQVEMAKALKVTQPNLSQMEKGTRPIGKTIAKRIEALYDIDYRSFLA